MPDVNTMIEQVLQALIWLLPGLLILIVLILALSYTDRPRRKGPRGRQSDNKNGPDTST